MNSNQLLQKFLLLSALFVMLFHQVESSENTSQTKEAESAEPAVRMLKCPVFFNEIDGELCQILGISSNGVFVSDNRGGYRQMKNGAYLVKSTFLPVAGSILLYGVEGTTGSRGTTISNYQAYTLGGSTTIKFHIRAEKDFEDVWVALLFYNDKDDEDPVAVSFGNIGDLESGTRTTRKVNYHLEVNSGLRFKYLFYTKGCEAISVSDLKSVYNKPETVSWGIPWQERLDTHLQIGENGNLSSPPKPFDVVPLLKDGAPIKNRGINEVQSILVVKQNGEVELKTIDERLLPNEVESIKKNLTKWRFFPCLKSGKAVDIEVKIPLRF